MAKLLRADFARLFSYKRFLLLLGLTAALAAYLNYGNIVSINENPHVYLYPFELLIYCSFIITTFIAFFSGINFTDGVIRNKLFAGYSKAQIYLSNAVVSAFMASVFTVLYMLGSVWLVIKNVMDLKTYLAYVFVCVLASVAFSSLGTFASFVCRGKAIPIVMSALIIVGMLYGTDRLNEILGMPEYSEVIDTVNGVPLSEIESLSDGDDIVFKTVRNSQYISDKNIRKTLDVICKFFPTTENASAASCCYIPENSKYLCHRENYTEMTEIKSPKNAFNIGNVPYSLAFIAVFTCAGVFIFRKEDLK